MAGRPAYDLMILIDAEAPEDRRAAIVAELKQQISSGGGELKGDADWGLRKLAYEIDHRPEAHYHLFQLEADPDLLNQLDRSLSINDAVLRHRIIRLPRGAPEETPRPSPPPSRYSESTGERPDSEPEQRDAPAEQRDAPAEDAPAEQPEPAGSEQPA